MKNPSIKHVVFDWSGTLYNDHDVSFLATQETIKYFSGHTLSQTEYHQHFTLPVSRFYSRYIKNVSIKKIDEYYFNCFANHYSRGSLFAGVLETLKYLKKNGVMISIFSTVRQDLLDALCKKYKLSPFIDFIQGSVFDKIKEFPTHLKKIAARPQSTLFIGDTDHDVKAAQQNGLLSGCVLNGYHHPQKLLSLRPQFVWQNQTDFLPFFKRLQQPLPVKTAPERPLVTVGALIFNKKGEVFLTLTHKWGYTYGIPGGKIDKGETAEQAIIREIKEETAMSLQKPQLFMVQDCIDSTEFYIPHSHQVLLNYLGKTSHPKYQLNDEAVSALWLPPELALFLNLNQPTRLLLEYYLNSLKK